MLSHLNTNHLPLWLGSFFIHRWERKDYEFPTPTFFLPFLFLNVCLFVCLFGCWRCCCTRVVVFVLLLVCLFVCLGDVVLLLLLFFSSSLFIVLFVCWGVCLFVCLFGFGGGVGGTVSKTIAAHQHLVGHHHELYKKAKGLKFQSLCLIHHQAVAL